jgi:hypothetical protein
MAAARRSAAASRVIAILAMHAFGSGEHYGGY